MIDANTGQQSRPFEATVSPCSKKPCTLANCPPGLFMSPDGYMGLKTEYANERGGSEAYVVASGEYWWGGEHTHETREKQLVWPCEVRANVEVTGKPLRGAAGAR